ncbi:hypothetical protein [Cupriavidus necator]|uniref:hypothetical protein n=1 Tax=Cupriavidus necator TaxID=106590 RepID=UPI001E42ECC0|nr:hypothetical protein [Cupriavidus necator]
MHEDLICYGSDVPISLLVHHVFGKECAQPDVKVQVEQAHVARAQQPGSRLGWDSGIFDTAKSTCPDRRVRNMLLAICVRTTTRTAG